MRCYVDPGCTCHQPSSRKKHKGRSIVTFGTGKGEVLPQAIKQTDYWSAVTSKPYRSRGAYVQRSFHGSMMAKSRPIRESAYCSA